MNVVSHPPLSLYEYNWTLGVCNLLFCVVTEKLPIALTPEDVEQNPEFGKLLKALTQHILPSGALAASEEDVQEVSAIQLQ